jgi:hypothetical protein
LSCDRVCTASGSSGTSRTTGPAAPDGGDFAPLTSESDRSDVSSDDASQPAHNRSAIATIQTNARTGAPLAVRPDCQRSEPCRQRPQSTCDPREVSASSLNDRICRVQCSLGSLPCRRSNPSPSRGTHT